MIIDAASRAFSEMFSKEYRTIFWKVLAITFLALVFVAIGLQNLAEAYLVTTWPWLTTAIIIMTGFGLVISAGFLLAPVMSVFAGFFLDEIAEHTESQNYPDDEPGAPTPLMEGLGLALRFLLLVLLVNFVTLILSFLLGLNIVIFFVANGYLLGREYFQFVALRFYTSKEAADMRKAHSGSIFFGGMLIALMLAVPLLNLLTPLFATIFMVHLFKSLEKKEAR